MDDNEVRPVSPRGASTVIEQRWDTCRWIDVPEQLAWLNKRGWRVVVVQGSTIGGSAQVGILSEKPLPKPDPATSS